MNKEPHPHNDEETSIPRSLRIKSGENKRKIKDL